MKQLIGIFALLFSSFAFAQGAQWSSAPPQCSVSGGKTYCSTYFYVPGTGASYSCNNSLVAFTIPKSALGSSLPPVVWVSQVTTKFLQTQGADGFFMIQVIPIGAGGGAEIAFLFESARFSIYPQPQPGTPFRDSDEMLVEFLCGTGQPRQWAFNVWYSY